MDQSSDGDQDSLFGSPPSSPARGRSPYQETTVVGEQVGLTIAVPSAGAARKNVGTIALPGSHMSCAELPANLPAPSPEPTCLSSSHRTLSIAPPVTGTSVRATATARPRQRSTSSRAPSSASTRRRTTSKAKSLTPAPSPITLPGPNEPTPPNFLRSQSSLLGLAGLVGSVKPAQLYTQSTPVAQSPPIRGSTPAHPIILDDDAPHDGEESSAQPQLCLDQVDPDLLRPNILTSLVQEKNIFPVLESLIKLLGGEPCSPANPPNQPFMRPYGHGIFQTQSPSPTSGSVTPTAPPPKRRKLKHVPAGAIDWDVPFPFPAGEGPEGYRETWARDRTKQLLTQLLELVQNATKRVTCKTAKRKEPTPEQRAGSQNRRSSTTIPSIETQSGRTDLLAKAHACLPCSRAGQQNATTATESTVAHLGDLSEVSNATGSLDPNIKDKMDAESGCIEGGPAVPCDYSVFEEWLAQLQQCWDSRPPESLDSSTPDHVSSVHTLAQGDDLSTPHTISDEAIDPTLLDMCQLGGFVPQPQSSTLPTSTVTPGAVRQVTDMSTLIHSPHTSLSSPTEPLTPLSEPCVDVPASMVHSDLPSVEKDNPPRILSIDTSENACTDLVQKGKSRAEVSIAAGTPSGRLTPVAMGVSKGVFDKQTILERARERRRQLVAEIERAKLELWETTIENAILVHITRDGTFPS